MAGLTGFQFAQISDPHYGNPGRPGKPLDHRGAMARALKALAGRPVEFVLFTGDMTEDGSPEQVAEFRADAAGISVPVYYSAGNHDVGDEPTPESVRRYEAAYGPACSAFVHRGCAFVGFNSMVGGKPAVQYEAVRQLAELGRLFEQHSGTAQRVVFGHVPLFLERADEPKNYWNIEPAYRAELLRLFGRHRPAACLTGHLHRNLANTHEGVLYQSSSALSFQLGDDAMGLRIWTVDAAGVGSEYVPV